MVAGAFKSTECLSPLEDQDFSASILAYSEVFCRFGIYVEISHETVCWVVGVQLPGHLQDGDLAHFPLEGTPEFSTARQVY